MLKVIVAFLVGLILGTVIVARASSGGGWSDYQVRQAIGLLQEIAANTRK